MENGACVVFDVSQGEFDSGELLALWERSVRVMAGASVLDSAYGTETIGDCREKYFGYRDGRDHRVG